MIFLQPWENWTLTQRLWIRVPLPALSSRVFRGRFYSQWERAWL